MNRPQFFDKPDRPFCEDWHESNEPCDNCKRPISEHNVGEAVQCALQIIKEVKNK